MDKHPEYLILIAVAAALVACIIGGAISCSTIVGAAQNAAQQATPGYNELIEQIEGNHDGDANELLDELLGGNNGGNNGNGNGGNNGSNNGGEGGNSADTDVPDVSEGIQGGFTEKDVPASMDIDVPELQDDLQACLNSALSSGMRSNATVTLTELTKDTVSAPTLKGGRVLGTVSGKATITNADGKTETVDYTSYYLAANPTDQKITWYIYGYDLSSYDLFPQGFKDVAGDPMGMRSVIDGGVPSPQSELGRDQGQNAQAV